MDFNDSAKEAQFREEASTWLKANAPTEEELKGLTELEQDKLWQKRKSEGGWACLTWPKNCGGRGATLFESVIFNQEEEKLKLPSFKPFIIGTGMCAPTIMMWGTEEQKEQYLPNIASGEKIWCQLFSEPAAGSDLAGLKTKAEKDDDDWVINGQKVWTSFAQHADYAIIVLRTDPTVAKHKGLSYFFIDMKSPGVEVKPIKQISGDAEFNEVYLTDVRVPNSQMLGQVGQGWQVALTTLMNERATIMTANVSLGTDFGVLFDVAKKAVIDEEPAIKNSAVRAKLANWYMQEQGVKFTAQRAMTALSKGGMPGPEMAIGKLVRAVDMQDSGSFGMDLLESSGIITDEAYMEENDLRLFEGYMLAPGIRIAGGTDEVMGNVIAEQVLGLPQDIRVDKGVPFNEIPSASNRK